MKRIRLTLAAAAALAAGCGFALTPALASAQAPATVASAAARPAAAASAVFCTGTSLVAGTSDRGAVQLRVPTVGNGTGDDNCNLAEGAEPNGSVPVMRLQIALDNGNCAFGAGLTVDGDYGPDTEAAVHHLQAGIGVHADGEYGPVTGKAMKWPVAGSNGAACGNILSISG